MSNLTQHLTSYAPQPGPETKSVFDSPPQAGQGGDTWLQHGGTISELSEDIDLDECESLQIIDERGGGVLDGRRGAGNNNIVWVSPVPREAGAGEQSFQEHLFDMFFLNKYRSKKFRKIGAGLQLCPEDPDKIERVTSACSGGSVTSPRVKTLSMILREAGFEVPGDEASLETGELGDFSLIFGPRESNWVSHFDKTAHKVLCQQFIFVSLILFIFLHLTSVVLVAMFYCSSSKIFG